MGTLVFVSWYCHHACYLDGKFVHFGETTQWSLLRSLGYECSRLDDVPTHNIPPEFDRQVNGWWKPPESLDVLMRQFAAWRERQKKEEVIYLKSRLRELEGGK